MDTTLSPLAQLAVDPDRLGAYLRDAPDQPEAAAAGDAPGVQEPERPGVREPDGVREPEPEPERPGVREPDGVREPA